MNIYAIEGLIGNGKSTVVRLAKGVWATNKVTFIEEPIEEMANSGDGPSLEEFYKSMGTTAVAFQKRVIDLWFAEAIAGLEIAKANSSKAIVTDRSVFSPLAFTRVLMFLGHISRAEYKELKASIIQRAAKENLIPSKMVIFSAPAKLLLERIAKRGRAGESQITKDYLNMLAKEQLWLGGFLARKYGVAIQSKMIQKETHPEEMLKCVANHFGLPKLPIGYFMKLDKEATVPQKPYSGDVGIDLCSIKEETILPGKRQEIKTGLALRPPIGHYFQVFARSSMAKMGLDVSGGVIDTGYTGEITVILINNSDKPVRVEKGAKVAQVVPIRCAVEIPLFEEQEMKETERGTKGFGSSDAKKPRVYFEE